MLRRGLSLAVLTISFAGFACLTLPLFASARSKEAGAQKQIVEGREVFLRLCASCHGVDAKGQGLVAQSLKNRPADLTRISAKYGEFPTAKIRAIIIGDPLLPVHGSKEMPVWGGMLKDLELANLLKYLASIQRIS